MFRTATALAICLTALPAGAEPTQFAPPPAQVDQSTAFIDAFAVAMDSDADGQISAGELDLASTEVFGSMDIDGDGFLSRTEMMHWEYGFNELAAFRGRQIEFNLAIDVVFDLFDASGDGQITPDEHKRGLQLARRLADRDGDGMLSLTEFREDFIVITTLRRGVGSEGPADRRSVLTPGASRQKDRENLRNRAFEPGLTSSRPAFDR